MPVALCRPGAGLQLHPVYAELGEPVQLRQCPCLAASAGFVMRRRITRAHDRLVGIELRFLHESLPPIFAWNESRFAPKAVCVNGKLRCQEAITIIAGHGLSLAAMATQFSQAKRIEAEAS